MPSPLRSPVVLLLFARPDTTARLVELVRAARPPLVLVVADGPRADRPGEADLCEATRELVERTDWGCEVLTDYADENRGMKRRIETGLDWAFGQVEEAILLEDDCIPHPTFFRFCDELLERFRDEPRVLSIAGGRLGPGATDGASYRFSRYQHIWGWATWRRAWGLHDPLLARWPELRDSRWLDRLLGDRRTVEYWSYAYEQTHTRRHTWDHAWQLAAWLAGGLSVIPSRNLVENVGFRDDATTTRPEFLIPLFAEPAVAMDFPLRHPPAVVRDAEADRFLEEALFGGTVERVFARIHARRPQASEVRP
jgi:hypothetical protein